MKIEVSDGEIVDKYSIVCLKLERIQDNTKRDHLLIEKQLIQTQSESIIHRFPLYYHLLCHVNQVIWEKTDIMKTLNHQDDGYALLASEIFAYNDRRFRLKRIFNEGSHVKEQKSYASKTITIEATEDLATIISLVVEYDHVWIVRDDCHQAMIEAMIPVCCFSWVDDRETTVPHKHVEMIDVIQVFISGTFDKEEVSISQQNTALSTVS